MERPNIVFYFSDQQRFDTLGCYGQSLPVTPCLDQLATESVRFQNAFTCQPVCGPARSCLQTGLYATETGCFTNAISLSTSARTLAHHFNEAGYDTAYIGKWHLASDRDCNHYETSNVPVERRGGYRYWMAADVLEFTSHGYNGYVFDTEGNKREFIGYRADCINNFAIDYLHNRPKEKPFFLFVSHIEPHNQNDHMNFEGPDGSKEKFKVYVVPGDLEGTGGDWRQFYPDYLGECHSLDANVGRLIDTLKTEGIWDNTILIYTSDHGCHFRTRTPDYKRSCHENSLHIPLIIHGKQFSRGAVIDHLVSLIDLPPTLLDCAGIPVPDSYQGQSLLPLLKGEAPESWPDSVFFQVSENQVGRGIRTKEWKYSARGTGDGWEDSSCDTYYEEFLFDLTKDPYEKNNLVADPAYALLRKELAAQLQGWIQRVECKQAQILPADAHPAE